MFINSVYAAGTCNCFIHYDHASSYPCRFSWCSCLSFPSSAHSASVLLTCGPCRCLTWQCLVLSWSAVHVWADVTLHSWLLGCPCIVCRLLLCMHIEFLGLPKPFVPMPLLFLSHGSKSHLSLHHASKSTYAQARVLNWACAMRTILITTCSVHTPIVFNLDRRTDSHMDTWSNALPPNNQTWGSLTLTPN